MDNIDQHFKMLESKMNAMTKQEVRLFCGLCFESLWATFLDLYPSAIPNFDERVVSEINANLEAVWNFILGKQESEGFEIERFDDYLAGLDSEIDWDAPDQVACYNIVNNALDIVTAFFEQDIDYLKEFVAYRNIDFIAVWEENIDGDVVEIFEQKSDSIKELYERELSRQKELAKFVLGNPSVSEIKSAREEARKSILIG